MEHFRAQGSVEQNLENILTPNSSWMAGIPGYEASRQVDGKGGGTFRKGGSQGPQTMHSSPTKDSSGDPGTELSMNGQAEEGETEAQRGQSLCQGQSEATHAPQHPKGPGRRCPRSGTPSLEGVAQPLLDMGVPSAAPSPPCTPWGGTHVLEAAVQWGGAEEAGEGGSAHTEELSV